MRKLCANLLRYLCLRRTIRYIKVKEETPHLLVESQNLELVLKVVRRVVNEVKRADDWKECCKRKHDEIMLLSATNDAKASTPIDTTKVRVASKRALVMIHSSPFSYNLKMYRQMIEMPISRLFFYNSISCIICVFC